MGTITIGQRSFETPVLVPSVSSFETQLQPSHALRLQYTLREPISLVSAYDVWFNRKTLTPICKKFREHGVLLLDSGGYESSRISSYAREERKRRWNFSKYANIAADDIYDFIFSYDYFLGAKESAVAYQRRLVREFRTHSEILDETRLIPVIHTQSADGKRRLNQKEIVDLFGAVATGIKCVFVAVPERELGSGIVQRASLTREIVDEIKRTRRDCSLHILGCGNLLSYSLLAVAGAMICDGLEWCRTLAADNFHLHHFQQKDIFADPGHHLGNPIAEFLVGEMKLDYPTAVAVRNLMCFQAFTRDLHHRLGQRSVHEFVTKHFGSLAGNAVRELEK